ncbi:Na(+)/H(+) antiporter subunit G [Croceibacterium mercuriale]|uniref:Na(+)/H(+) antiporter subunit G n=1 Tax=Croceibacterium mercuriale TaxID=1572751 RepID=A0A0B2C0R4_9SPHN|nr:monovalent cation/H(+) antiporter subunit G [Croceibacterium mercuriale]KHL25581.1 Na(+)/H(+) antiporter subunit G [Croceibacterium mercuriale]
MLAMILQGLGAAFLLIAAIGVIRLPDPLQRMHSATKAGTLGTTLLLLGVMASGELDRSGSGWLPILFLLVTLPLGAQLLARGSYLSGTRLEGLEDDPLAEELGRPRNATEQGTGIDLP